MPDDIVSRIEGKSSLGRLGLIVHATAGFVDPGFSGSLTLEITNLTRVPIILWPGKPIAQLSFMTLDAPAERPYGHPELGSHYHGQVDATESRYEGGPAKPRGGSSSPPRRRSVLAGGGSGDRCRRDRADEDRPRRQAADRLPLVRQRAAGLLIQGLAGTIDGWPPSFLDSVAAAHHRVVIFDNEGVGRSTLRAGTLSIRRMAQDTARLIGALRLQRPDVVGWSMGGMTAQSFAVNYPKRLRRLVLMATAPGDGKATLPDARALQELASGDAAKLLARLFPPGDTTARDRYVSDILRRLDFNGIAPPAIVTAQLGASANGSRAAIRTAPVPHLKARTLVGGGELDELLPVANQRHLAALIPHAKLITYPDAGARVLFPARRGLRAAAGRLPALIDSRAWSTTSPRWSSPSTTTSRPRCRSTSAAACSPCGPSSWELSACGARPSRTTKPAPARSWASRSCSSRSRSRPR